MRYKIQLGAFALFIGFSSVAQVEIDQPVSLTGSTESARQVTGLAFPEGPDHAVSVDVIQRGLLQTGIESGEGNAFEIFINPTPDLPYSDGMVVYFITGHSNSGASTLSINEQVFDLVRSNGDPLESGDLSTGQAVAAIKDGDSFKLLSVQGGSSSGGGGAADNGLSVAESVIQLGGTLIQTTNIDQDGNDLSFSGAGEVSVEGAFSTRPHSLHITGAGQLDVTNKSHLILTTSGSTATQPWILTLNDGKAGQHLVLELESGFAALNNTGNLKLTGSVGLIIPFSVLHLKWDSVNEAWVELSRNAFIAPNLLSPPTSYNGRRVFTHTGEAQTFEVPNSISTNYIYVKMWGAGGGNGTGCGSGPNNFSAGGSGAFVGGWMQVTPGSTLTVIVGGRGQTASGTNLTAPGGFGGGGTGGASSNVSGVNRAASGGGRSAIQVTPGDDYVTAGGGGGAGVSCSPEPFGGGGGAPNGASAGNYEGGGVVAQGGTTTAGGAGGTGGANGSAGTQYQGGSGGSWGRAGGGGGGGYYGGGGGPGNNSGTTFIGGGGGGSSFTANLINPQSNIAGPSGYSTSSWSAPNTSDPDYVSGVGGSSQNGLVVIYW